jgi:hypothetical protein
LKRQRKEETPMGVDLRMEPYAEIFQKERPRLRIIDEFCFLYIDKLFGHLGMRWDDYSVDAVNGRLPLSARSAALLRKLGQYCDSSDVAGVDNGLFGTVYSARRILNS